MNKVVPREIAVCPECESDLFVREYDCSYGEMPICSKREGLTLEWKEVYHKVAVWVETLPPKVMPQPPEEEESCDQSCDENP